MIHVKNKKSTFMINKDFIIYYFIAKVKIRYTSSMELIVLHAMHVTHGRKKRFSCAPHYGLPVLGFFFLGGGGYFYICIK